MTCTSIGVVAALSKYTCILILLVQSKRINGRDCDGAIQVLHFDNLKKYGSLNLSNVYRLMSKHSLPLENIKKHTHEIK